MIRETDRCTEIVALQNKFGGPGRAKFSPSTKYSPESIKLRVRTNFASEGSHSTQKAHPGSGKVFSSSNSSSNNIDSISNNNSSSVGGSGSKKNEGNEKLKGRMGMFRTKSDNDCKLPAAQTSSLASVSASAMEKGKGQNPVTRPRSYSHELVMESSNYFGGGVITHEAAAASRLSLRAVDSEKYFDDNSDDIIYGGYESSKSQDEEVTPLTEPIVSKSDSTSPVKGKGITSPSITSSSLRNEHLHFGSVSNIDISSPTNGLDFVLNENGDAKKLPDSILFSQSEIMGLRLMFSLFDRFVKVIIINNIIHERYLLYFTCIAP